jgi:hypothetical protein
VKPSAAINPNVEITDVGMATAAMMVGASRAERKNHQAGEDAAENQVHIDLV